jgi:TusA-related sulfurtransferase
MNSSKQSLINWIKNNPNSPQIAKVIEQFLIYNQSDSKVPDPMNSAEAIAIIENTPILANALDPNWKVLKASYHKNLLGVECPRNFFKVSATLQKMQLGDTLEVFLDAGSPIENVPIRLTQMGYKVNKRKKIADYWVLLVEKTV